MIKKTAPAPRKAPAPKKRSATSKKPASAKKPSAAKKKKSSRPQNTIQPKNNGRIWDRIVTVMTTSFFLLFAVFVAYVLLHPQTVEKPSKVQPASREKVIPLKIARFEKPDFEIFPAEPIPSRRAATTLKTIKKELPKPPQVIGDKLPMLAIIIDDLGYDMALAKKIMALDKALTCAILPHSVHDRQMAQMARKEGHEVMLHQPMEPTEYPLIDPGPGALLSAMTPDERIKQLNENLDLIPEACGVNNHMGSKTTTMSDEMNQIFTVLKKRGLFFIDSRTTAATLSISSARLFKVPFAERDVFLDHVRDESKIRAQLEHLVNIAEIHGKALGIGHPYDATYQVLKKELPGIKKQVRLVPASQIVEVF